MTDVTPRSGIPPLLLVVLALLASVAPFSTDLYLPAFPLMAADLDTSATAIQLTLTSFLVGLAIGQLVFGPLSDRLGRRGPLLVGAVLFAAASVAAVFAPSIEFLIAARFLQGLSGAAGMVLGRAVIADRERGDAAARAFSLMMIVGGIAPIIAPLAGSLVVDVLGWRGILAVLAALAVAMLLASWFVVEESLPRERRGRGAAGGFRALGSLGYAGPAATFVLGFAAMMAYISASPFLYQEVMGLDAVVYGVLFGVNALGLAAASALATRLLRTIPARGVLGMGVAGLIGATGVLFVLSVSGAPAGWMAVPIFVAVSSLGFVMGPATALALAAVPTAVGTGSAVLGAGQFGLGALVSPLVSLEVGNATLPLAIVMLVLALLAGAAHLAGRAASPQAAEKAAGADAADSGANRHVKVCVPDATSMGAEPSGS
ncbi:multidrug effflux MFS transporter [Microbacterium thalassium]|uniref:DHA1 family bicyclomycin/chloramphenicol resistance-like MFS transporter n=1 Tax=Microbacterium thalassium TaxID=362649 RepID=A0A7X0FNE6_9MICO|nr:multidrug effflux MFS transporter [Microbacterium thalassium]MBB6390713.1 DHA1 family bicyclomycin/chloramphenicol resistance-like MFS transporter [Microbacterium thalassium]GLK25822.1 Bcr/CflA family drug resistance efflux transporter [Microbacterium thalassium]